MRTVYRNALTASMAAVALVAGTVSTAEVAHADPGGIVISELHYHAVSDLDGDDYLELVNTGASAIDVSGWTFTAGVGGSLPGGSIIPAGSYFVVARDAVQFQTTYGFAPDAVYTGNLSNGGETVTLFDGVGNVDSVAYLDASPWPTEPDANGPSLELRDLLSDNTLAENWGASTVNGGTPRAVNTLDGTPPVPRIVEVAATPTKPNPNQAVQVSARLPVGSSATLRYKVMFGNDVSVPFLDDAASPGGAGDNVFAAVIPGQAAGRLVRYRIDASKPGVTFSHPAGDDTINYEGYVVANPAVVTELPVIEWFMSDAVYNDILANHRYDNVNGEAVIAYGDQVIDNAGMRVRGQSSRDDAKVNWKVELPSGHDLDMTPLMPYPLDEFALQADLVPKSILAWDTVGEAAARRLGIFTMRMQRNGQFWGVGEAMELEDGSWRDDQGVDDWAIYKGNFGALATRPTPAALQAMTNAGCALCLPEEWLEKKSREDEDYTDVWQLTQAVDASSSPAQRAWLRANVNIPELVNYMAINTVLRHQDSNQKNWWVARDTEGTGRWEMWHWDLNRSWTTLTADKGPFLSPAQGNRLLEAAMADPEISRMFYRRLRTLADQFLTPGQYESRWDAEVTPYLSDWSLERAMWGGLTPSVARSRFVNVLQDRRTVIASNTAPNGPVPVSQSAAPTVVINEIHYQPAGGTAGEFLELTNPSGSEAVDLSGWTIEGIELTIPPGTVLLPGEQVVFVKDDVAFRGLHNGGTTFVGGEYAGELSDSGETLRLLDGARVVDQVAYAPTAPWPTTPAGSGPSLELSSPAADNSLPTSWQASAVNGGTPSQPNGDGGDPPPTVLFSDTFTGATGSPWANQWTASTSNGSATIQANAGALSVNNVSNAYSRAALAGVAATADTEVLFSYAWNSGTPRAQLNVSMRGSGGWNGNFRPRNGYSLQFTSDSRTVLIRRTLNGNVSTLRSTSNVQTLGSGRHWVRMQVTGNTIRYRVWLDGQSEPTGWRASVTNSAVTAPGQLFVSVVRTTGATQAKTVTIDDLVLSSL